MSDCIKTLLLEREKKNHIAFVFDWFEFDWFMFTYFPLLYQ